jgi:hypothetical protein
MEDALRGAERDRRREERAAGGDQPAGARVGAAQPARDEHGEPAGDGEAEQPPGLAAEAGVEQPQHARVAAEDAAATSGRAAVLPAQPAEAVVAKDQRPHAVVAGAGHPRSGIRGRERDQRGPGASDDDHRGASGQQLARRDQAAARRDPQVRRRDARHDHQRRGHLGLEAEADADTGEDEPARPTVLQRAHDRPQRGDRAEDQQRVGVVVPRDRHGDRREREHDARDESAGAPERPPDEVVDERHRPDAHQRLRDEQRP